MSKIHSGAFLVCALMAEGIGASAEKASASQVAALNERLEVLRKQVFELAERVKASSPAPKTTLVAKPEATAPALAPKNAPVFEEGYIPVPGTTAAVKISGMVKLDAIADTKLYTGEQTNPSRLPYSRQLKDYTLITGRNYRWNRHFYMHAKQSKFCVRSVVKNASGKDVSGRIEGDLFGSSQWGDAFPPSPVSGTYNFRLRFAYLDYDGWRAGQDCTTFMFDDVYLPSVDINGLMLGNLVRQPVARYTYERGGFSAAVAIERPLGDYVTYNSTVFNASNYVYQPQDSSGNYSKPIRPDTVLKLKYVFSNKNILGLALISRDLRIKYNVPNAAAADGRTYTAQGYGANLTAKIMTVGQNFIVGGFIFGKGIGTYIQEMNGRSALLADITNNAAAVANRRYRALPMYEVWAGYSHSWNSKWTSNVGLSYSRLNVKRNLTDRPVNRSTEPGLDRDFGRALLNTVYKPENNVEIGLEHMLMRRKSALSSRANGSRWQLAMSYKF